MIKNKHFWIGIVLSLSFLGLFLYRADITEIWEVLKQANYIFILPAILVYFFGVWLRALRWQYLLRPLGFVPSHRLFPMIVVGFMVNNVVPGRLGIIARSFLLGGKEGISKMATSATVLVERIFDVLVLLSFLIFPLLFITLPSWAGKIVWIVFPIFVVILICVILVASSDRLTQRIITIVERLAPKRWKQRLINYIESFISGLGLLRNPASLILIFIISLAVWLSEAAVFYIVSLSFGLGQPFYVLLLATSISNLAYALLVSPGGVGPFEYACQQILIFFSIGISTATAYAATLHATIILPPTILGFIFLAAGNLSLSQITKIKDASQPLFEENKD